MIHSETQRLAAACTEAADRSADADGFVAVRRLVEHFGADLRAQPLLYEGMIAAPKTDKAKWLVLIDAFESGYTPERYQNERSAHALPVRLRFTIAHELSHLVHFKSEGAGGKKPKAKSHAAEVGALEREADTLSPLLLIPESAFERRFAGGSERLTLERILEARIQWAVSREVLVNRFNLLGKYDPKSLRLRAPLQNIGLGMGVWGKDRQATVIGWPKPYCNFSENLVPDFLRESRPGKAVVLNTFFGDPDFVLNGGRRNFAVTDMMGGTPANPQIEKMRVKLSVEITSAAAGHTFLILAERLS